MLNVYLELDKVIQNYLLSIDMEINRIPRQSLMALESKDNNFG